MGRNVWKRAGAEVEPLEWRMKNPSFQWMATSDHMTLNLSLHQCSIVPRASLNSLNRRSLIY